MSEDNLKRYTRTLELAKRKRVSPAQIALAFLFHQKLNLFAVIGCRTIKTVRENIGALDIELSDAEVAWLELGEEHAWRVD